MQLWVMPVQEPIVEKLVFRGQISNVAGGLTSTRDLQHWGHVYALVHPLVASLALCESGLALHHTLPQAHLY